jgi:hybrid cluster-associated redox disulfide protein
MTKKTKIRKDTNIAEAIESNEKVAKVLFENGVGCMGCMMAHSENLYEGLMNHGFSEEEIDRLIDKMNK